VTVLSLLSSTCTPALMYGTELICNDNMLLTNYASLMIEAL